MLQLSWLVMWSVLCSGFWVLCAVGGDVMQCFDVFFKGACTLFCLGKGNLVI